MTETAPPDLPGYEHLRELGRGGFADVHLYRQHLPSREVAIKVLRHEARSEGDRATFENEANRMAMLSSHPGIVTIYEVGVAPDDRPYLTMEFCPHDHFGSIVRTHPLTVARALEVGVKVAAAVETAHRASILHRDIKPANILLTAYGDPALTDFGIAGAGGEDDREAISQGVSIPFAAPEVLNGSTSGDEQSDVYSLGATVYALLAGRSPFSTGAALSDAELIQRVLHAPLPPTGRTDVPASLERVLANAVARDPANRYQSAAAFGRALQGIEAELGLAQTALRIADTAAVPPPPSPQVDDDRTRFRAPQRVDPDGPAGPPIAGVPAAGSTGARPAAAAAAATWTDTPAPPADGGLADHTVHRGDEAPAPIAVPPAVPAVEPAEGPASTRTRLVVTVVGGLLLAAVVALVLSQRGGDGGGPTVTSATTPDTSPLVVDGAPGRPEAVTIQPAAGGGQRVTWTTPSVADGDTYQVYVTSGPDDLVDTSREVEAPALTLETDERVCVIVETVRSGRVSDASTEVCSA